MGWLRWEWNRDLRKQGVLAAGERVEGACSGIVDSVRVDGREREVSNVPLFGTRRIRTPFPVGAVCFTPVRFFYWGGGHSLSCDLGFLWRVELSGDKAMTVSFSYKEVWTVRIDGSGDIARFRTEVERARDRRREELGLAASVRLPAVGDYLVDVHNGGLPGSGVDGVPDDGVDDYAWYVVNELVDSVRAGDVVRYRRAMDHVDVFPPHPLVGGYVVHLVSGVVRQRLGPSPGRAELRDFAVRACEEFGQTAATDPETALSVLLLGYDRRTTVDSPGGLGGTLAIRGASVVLAALLPSPKNDLLPLRPLVAEWARDSRLTT